MFYDVTKYNNFIIIHSDCTLCVDAIVQEVVKSSKDMHSRAMFMTQ